MGAIISRYRKKRNAEELLEDIEKEIEDIENSRQFAVQREKYIVWRLIFYSFLLYVISAILFYLYFLPDSLRDQVFYMIPLLIFPVIILFVKKSITWIYTRKISKDKTKLTSLRTKKKQILDDVMNTETYKVAKQILEKYAPEQVRAPPAPTKLQNSSTKTPAPATTPGRPGPGNVALVKNNTGQSVVPVMSPGTPMMASRPNMNIQPRRLIRPIIPPERGYIDRFIDSILGDGPNNRYALICKNCATHNGMALREEFEYLAYRCVYCGFPNPSLKVRSRPQLSLDYNTSPSLPSQPAKAVVSPESANNTSVEETESSGVIITEVLDTQSDKSDDEGVTPLRKRLISASTDKLDKSSTEIIKEEITLKEKNIDSDEEIKKTL